MVCATHLRVEHGLRDLRDRGVITPDVYAKASADNEAECGAIGTYGRRIAEQDEHGACVLRHP